MPIVRISDENFGRLQHWAEPLVDSFDEALSKALDAAESSRRADPPPHAHPSRDNWPRLQLPIE